jgi:hypothetical protein
MRTVILLCMAMAVSACAREMSYVRLDGRSAASDPVLAQQFEVDRTVCAGEMQKANVSGVTFAGGGMAGLAAQIERQQAVGQVAQGCMAQKGYLLVPKEDAPAKAAELASVNAEKIRRDEEAARTVAENSRQAKPRR